MILIFTASPKYAQFIWMAVTGIGFMAIFLGLESYRLERIAIWQNPEKYEKGYQTLQGLFAIGSGGLFGKGLGSSIQKLGFVPEAQNDMIFSIICEELGLVGAILVILLFFLLIWRFFVIASHASDLFGALIAAGAMAHMMIQVILNIAVVTNTIPNTGITLPFISYGGTSVVFLLVEWGLYSAWPVGKIETLMMEHTGGTSMNEQVVQRDEKRKELKRTSAGRSSKDWEAGRRFLLPSFCFSSYFSSEKFGWRGLIFSRRVRSDSISVSREGMAILLSCYLVQSLGISWSRRLFRV